MAILSYALRSALEKANYSKEYTDIPNNHPVMSKERELLAAMAASVGVDFEATEWTFTVLKKESGEIVVFGPSVVQSPTTGQAVLLWGKVEVNVSDLTDVAIDSFDDSEYLSVTVDDTELSFPIRVARGDDGEPAADIKGLRVALKKGNLGSLLVKPGMKVVKLSQLEPGIYTVIGYQPDNAFGKQGYRLELEGIGYVRANTKLCRDLDTQPMITADQPAILTVEPSTETTAQGWPIIPVRLETAEVQQVEVFSF